MTRKEAKKLFGKYMTTRSGSALLVITRDDYNTIIDLIFEGLDSKDQFRRVFQDG